MHVVTLWAAVSLRALAREICTPWIIQFPCLSKRWWCIYYCLWGSSLLISLLYNVISLLHNVLSLLYNVILPCLVTRRRLDIGSDNKIVQETFTGSMISWNKLYLYAWCSMVEKIIYGNLYSTPNPSHQSLIVCRIQHFYAFPLSLVLSEHPEPCGTKHACMDRSCLYALWLEDVMQQHNVLQIK